MLYHASGRDDLIIGTPVRGRNNVDVEHLMGFFTTLLPLRTRIDPRWSFSELVDRVRSLVLDSFANPDILLEDLQAESGRRGQRNSSLYHALFSFQDARRRKQHWGALTHERITLFQRGATEDLGLWFLEDDQGLQGGLVYNDEVLLAETADALHRRLMRILARVAEDPALSIAALADPELAGPAECMPESVRAMAEAESTQGEDDAEDLSRLQGQAGSGHHAETAQADARERMLTRIFQDVIGIEAIGPDDNFFDLGGTSLLAIRLVKRVEQASGVRLNLIQLATGTVASLARGLPEAAPARGRGIGALWRRWTGRSASGKP
jgi:non-ribosomal peptide synthetase component F